MEFIKSSRKKANFLASHQYLSHPYTITVEKDPGTRYFVSERLYLNRKKIFLSKLKTTTYRKVNARDTLKINTNRIYIYEVLNHNKIKGSNAFLPVKEDFIIPEERNLGWHNFRFDQEHYKFINCTFRNSLTKIILPEDGNTVQYSHIYRAVNFDDFLSHAEKDSEKILTKDFTKLLNVYQESYFLYDRNNIAKTFFVNELNNFLFL